MNLRPYQSAALEALESHWRAGGGAGLLDMATATGKSLVIAEALRRRHAVNPNLRSLVTVHVRELVEQDVDALLTAWHEAPYGICCEGLGRRDYDAPIIIGSVQSLTRDADKLGRRDLVMVDECQMIPRSGDGQYLNLFDNLRSRAPNLQLVGASATCYRLDSGYLHKGDGALFEKIVFSYQIREGIRDGYLSPLRSKATNTRIDVRGVHIRGGEFIPSELERAANVADVVEGAVAEIVEWGKDRRAWICFCTGVAHAYAVRDEIRRHGISCETVTAETPGGERRAIFDAFRGGAIRCLTGANIFSVGFNIPQVDLIALLRPTCSPGLLVQQVGRGTRLAPDKENCLVLDFAGNIRPHGPIDAIQVNGRTSPSPGDVLTKTCPQCQEEYALAARTCTCCGHIFLSERVARHDVVSDTVPVLLAPVWLHVRQSEFRLHRKRGDPSAAPTLRVEHLSGFSVYSEYVSIESSNSYARQLARNWWIAMGGGAPVPMSVTEAIERRPELDTVTDIMVTRDGQWWRINRRHVRRPDGSVFDVDHKYRCSRVAA
jgi:DNA repair protein RadD